MRLDRGQIEVMDEAMVNVYRNKTPAERLAIGLGMWRYTRQRLEGYLKWEHPDWDDPTIAREVSRRLLGGTK
jgi:hypothetical protein